MGPAIPIGDSRAAMAYMTCDSVDRAIECLDGYERAVRALSFPIELHGDDFSDKTQSWLEDMNDIVAGLRETVL